MVIHASPIIYFVISNWINMFSLSMKACICNKCDSASLKDMCIWFELCYDWVRRVFVLFRKSYSQHTINVTIAFLILLYKWLFCIFITNIIWNIFRFTCFELLRIIILGIVLFAILVCLIFAVFRLLCSLLWVWLIDSLLGALLLLSLGFLWLLICWLVHRDSKCYLVNSLSIAVILTRNHTMA